MIVLHPSKARQLKLIPLFLLFLIGMAHGYFEKIPWIFNGSLVGLSLAFIILLVSMSGSVSLDYENNNIFFNKKKIQNSEIHKINKLIYPIGNQLIHVGLLRKDGSVICRIPLASYSKSDAETIISFIENISKANGA